MKNKIIKRVLFASFFPLFSLLSCANNKLVSDTKNKNIQCDTNFNKLFDLDKTKIEEILNKIRIEITQRCGCKHALSIMLFMVENRIAIENIFHVIYLSIQDIISELIEYIKAQKSNLITSEYIYSLRKLKKMIELKNSEFISSIMEYYPIKDIKNLNFDSNINKKYSNQLIETIKVKTIIYNICLKLKKYEMLVPSIFNTSNIQNLYYKIINILEKNVSLIFNTESSVTSFKENMNKSLASNSCKNLIQELPNIKKELGSFIEKQNIINKDSVALFIINNIQTLFSIT
jgi:hypothetical protein